MGGANMAIVGTECAEALLRVRILMAGQGSMPAPQSRRDGAPTPIFVTLPGRYVAEVGLGPSGQTGRVYRPSGEPLSSDIDLMDPVSFASFMHNVDCCIRDGLGGVPQDVFLLADAIVRRPTPSLLEAVAANLDSCRWWEPTEEARDLLDQAREDLRPPAGDDFARSSIVRWHEQMDRWIHEDAGVPHRTVGDDGHRWRRIDTACGRIAAGWRVRDLGVVGGGERYWSGPGPDAGPQKMLEGCSGRELYLLETAADPAAALVAVERAEVVVLKSFLSDAPLAAALAALETEVGPTPPSPAP